MLWAERRATEMKAVAVPEDVVSFPLTLTSPGLAFRADLSLRGMRVKWDVGGFREGQFEVFLRRFIGAGELGMSPSIFGHEVLRRAKKMTGSPTELWHALSLLENQEKIPDPQEGECLVFTETVLTTSLVVSWNVNLYIPCLIWDERHKNWFLHTRLISSQFDWRGRVVRLGG